MTATAEPANLADALAAFQEVLPRVEKGNTGVIPGKDGKQGYRYDYADLADVSVVALPLLAKFGLSFSAKPTVNEAGAFVLEYRLRHRSGEEDIGSYPLPDPTRTPAQQVGSAITYGRRYCLCSVTGIAPGGDDDDGAAAQRTAPSAPAAGQGAAKPASNGNGTQRANQTPAPAPERDAQEAATRLLGAETQKRAEWVAGKVADNSDGALDATPYVTQDDREALGDRLDDKVSLDDLCAAVLGYWEAHGSGPRQADRQLAGAGV